MAERLIMDAAAVNRALTRMSHEILEKNKGTKDIVLLGVKTRGVFLLTELSRKSKTSNKFKYQPEKLMLHIIVTMFRISKVRLK